MFFETKENNNKQSYYSKINHRLIYIGVKDFSNELICKKSLNLIQYVEDDILNYLSTVMFRGTPCIYAKETRASILINLILLPCNNPLYKNVLFTCVLSRPFFILVNSGTLSSCFPLRLVLLPDLE